MLLVLIIRARLGASNVYPQHMFCREIKKELSIHFWIEKSILSRAMLRVCTDRHPIRVDSIITF